MDDWLATPLGEPVRASLRPPASAQDLDRLRREIEPHEIPPELVTVLRWHNGQADEPGSRLLPLPEGPLLGTGDAVRSYRFLVEECEPWQWCPLWVPIQQYRWSQTGVEIAGEGPSVVISTDFGDLDQTVVASSLTALLHATADMGEAGFLPTETPYAERNRLLRVRSDEFGWAHWPHDRVLHNDLEAVNWPERWRAASGFS